jgi:predicted Zn-dependent protease with MMP-like domain
MFVVRTIRNTYIQIYTNSVRTSLETHYFFATEPNRLMLFRETVAVYCENHMEHIQIYTNSVRTSQETHDISAAEPNRLMLFRETIAVYCENHMEHRYTNVQRFSLYLTGNTLRLRYRDQPVNVV